MKYYPFSWNLQNTAYCLTNSIKSNIDPLQWRHNGRDGVSNHQGLDCLLNRLFRHRLKKTSGLRVTGLCEGKSPVNSPHKGPVTRKMFPFDDVIMDCCTLIALENERALFLHIPLVLAVTGSTVYKVGQFFCTDYFLTCIILNTFIADQI